MKLNRQKIKAEMKRLEMTQSDLASKMGVTRQRISVILNYGAGTFRVVERIAKIFKLDPKDLIV
jgi:transcriptional regulator with XRE-family HTH domain